MPVWVLNDKGEKELVSFLIDGYEPGINTVYQFHGCHWHGHTCLKNKILCQPRNVKNQY